jgi:hypothetical protein
MIPSPRKKAVIHKLQRKEPEELMENDSARIKVNDLGEKMYYRPKGRRSHEGPMKHGMPFAAGKGINA